MARGYQYRCCAKTLSGTRCKLSNAYDGERCHVHSEKGAREKLIAKLKDQLANLEKNSDSESESEHSEKDSESENESDSESINFMSKEDLEDYSDLDELIGGDIKSNFNQIDSESEN